MLKSRDKVGYIFDKKYAQGYRVDDTHPSTHTRTHTNM